MSSSLWPRNCSMPGFSVLHYLPEFAQIHVHWVSDVIQPSYRPLFLLPSVFPSVRVFSGESAFHIKWPKYCSFSFSINHIIISYNHNHFNQLCWCCLVFKSCPTLYDPMDCSPAVCSVHGISQARVLEWVAISFSNQSTMPQLFIIYPSRFINCLPALSYLS